MSGDKNNQWGGSSGLQMCYHICRPRRHSLESESGTYTDDEVFGSEKEEPHIFVA